MPAAPRARADLLADARAWLTRMTAKPDGVLRYLLLAAAMEEDEARSACTATWASHVEHSLAELLEAARAAGAAEEREACAALAEADRLTITPAEPVPARVAEDMYRRGTQRLAAAIRARGPGG